MTGKIRREIRLPPDFYTPQADGVRILGQRMMYCRYVKRKAEGVRTMEIIVLIILFLFLGSAIYSSPWLFAAIAVLLVGTAAVARSAGWTGPKARGEKPDEPDEPDGAGLTEEEKGYLAALEKGAAKEE
jgi:hypothetical protein